MGAQSVLVRLLMKDVPQTNVMTGNMTQLGIAATELIMTRLVLARRRFDHSRQSDAAVREFATARDRLVTVLAMAVGFLAGAAGGASHFRVRIVAQAFGGLSPVARHRLVYAAVADLMPGEIHALALEALPPPR